MTHLLKLVFLSLLLILPQQDARFWPHFHGQDSQFAEYVQDYKALAIEAGYEFGANPSIGLEEFGEGNAIGRCYRSVGFREISIDSTSWATSTQITRRMLAYHELTHCYCTRGHDDDAMLDGCPFSVMSTVIMSDSCALSHFSHYTKEMFARCRPFR